MGSGGPFGALISTVMVAPSAVTRSGNPSPLKSAVATDTEFKFASHCVSEVSDRVPSPAPGISVTPIPSFAPNCEWFASAIARSIFPSRLKSPVMSCVGVLPA